MIYSVIRFMIFCLLMIWLSSIAVSLEQGVFIYLPCIFFILSWHSMVYLPQYIVWVFVSSFGMDVMMGFLLGTTAMLIVSQQLLIGISAPYNGSHVIDSLFFLIWYSVYAIFVLYKIPQLYEVVPVLINIITTVACYMLFFYYYHRFSARK